jgi:prepilin-type N-terminal cleavage/methylation domain-containing protein
MRSRRGFTFVELLVVMIIIGLLARIALPRYTDMKRRAIAAAIVSDVHTIRLATYTAYTENDAWPSETGPGIVPAELVNLLPTGFAFTHPDYEYDYENWGLSSGTPGNPGQQEIIGLSVTCNDPLLAQHLLSMAGKGFVPFAQGNKVTFFLAGVQGN